MPPANGTLIPDIDSTPGTTPPTNQTLQPQPATSGKKKKKNKKNGRQPKPWDDTSAEDTSYPKSVTPSPPVDHFSGVRLSSEPTPPNSEPEPEAVGLGEDDEQAVAAWTETPPQPPTELELELGPDEQRIPESEMLIQDYGDLDAPLIQEQPEERAPSPKPPPVPAPVISSPQSRDEVPAASRMQTPTAPASDTVPHKAEPTDDAAASKPIAVSERRRASSITKPQPPPTTQRKSFVEPANPPHMAQNHYFAVPGFDFGRSAAKPEKGTKQAGSEHYCCCFDSFNTAGDAVSATRAKDALIVGWEGGIEVYRVLPDKMEIVGRLEGLRGGVVGVKILPSVGSDGNAMTSRPLVALIIHGPMAGTVDNKEPEALEAEDTVPSKHYQTTAEVFSLQTQRHLSTLYKSLPVALPEAKLGQYAPVPEPVGDLRLDAKGMFITISSGKSGEIFVFAQQQQPGNHLIGFRCIGKYWTSLQSRFDVQNKPTGSSEQVPGNEIPDPQTAPLLSLSGRWLAFVPPSSSSKISVQGTLALSEGAQQPPGVGAHLAPPQPAVSCDILGLNAEGVLAKFSRQAAQEILKASRKGIEMGMAGWREFTQPSPPSRTAQRTDNGEEMFPPTNAPGEDTKRVAKEPAIVAVMDLERLLDAEENHAKHLPPPLASFALEDGCNHVSLSVDGLRMLTTSRKGEVSHIWDLRHAAHGSYHKRNTDGGESVLGPHVTRMQRILRNSHSVVLDSAWERDGNFVALLTAHGTVHMHEVSARAQESSKRRRRSTVVASPTDKADATVSLSTGLSPPSSNGFLGGIRSGWQTMSTQVSAMRSNNASESRAAFGIPTTFAGFREVTNAGAAASGRAIARGLSQGYSAARIGAADVWHADDNKIKHKDLPNNIATRSVRWLRTRGGMSIAVACGGKVQLYPVQRVTRQRGESTFSGLKAESKSRREFGLPNIATTGETASQTSKNTSSCGRQGPHGFWGLRAPAAALATGLKHQPHQAHESDSDKALYETNPPFCPLYIDRRVSMMGYNDLSPFGGDANSDHDLLLADFYTKGHGLDDEQPWLFGEKLPPSTKLNDRSAVSEASLSDDDDALAQSSPPSHERTFEAEIGEEAVEDAGVQSRIMINPANNEIRIGSSLRKSRRGQKAVAATGAKSGAGRHGEGEFDLIEDDEDGVF